MSTVQPYESDPGREAVNGAYGNLIQTLEDVDREFIRVARLKDTADNKDSQRRYGLWHSTLEPIDYGLNVPAYAQNPGKSEAVGDATHIEIRLPWGMPDYLLPHSSESEAAILSARQVLTVNKAVGDRPNLFIRTTVTYMRPDWGVPAKDDLRIQFHGRDIGMTAREFPMQALEVTDACYLNLSVGRRERTWYAHLANGGKFPSAGLGLSNPEMQADVLTESTANLASDVSGEALEEINNIIRAGLSEWRKWQENPPPEPVRWR